MTAKIHPLFSPWGRFGLYSYYVDAPEPAIVDTGIATSPAEGMAPALEKLGKDIRDVRWILLTHGHIDHVGGAHALKELTGGQAKTVLHEADAPMLRRRRAHVDEYLAGRGRYLNDPDGEAKQMQAAGAVISGEMEPDVLLRGGERIDLGGGVTVTVRSVPGHTAGSVAYVVDGQGDVFTGDAVQIHGAASGFPGYADPAAYRASLTEIKDDLKPRRLFLGHPYRYANGVTDGVELVGDQAETALQESLDIEARVAEAAARSLQEGPSRTGSPYDPFASVADGLGYDGDPTLEPSPFFTTLHGYTTKESRTHD